MCKGALPSFSRNRLLFVLVMICFSEAQNPSDSCTFKVVDPSVTGDCSGTFIAGVDGIYRKFTPLQILKDSAGKVIKSVADDTDWFFDSDDNIRLVDDTCTDASGTVTAQNVVSSCAGDNHVCVEDRAYPQNGPAFGSGVDGVDACPMYRELVWEGEFSGFYPKYSLYHWANGTHWLGWQTQYFVGCVDEFIGRCRSTTTTAPSVTNPGPFPSPTRVTFNLEDAACITADQYFPFLTVLYSDTTVPDCVGNYRLVKDQLWHHVTLSSDQTQFAESGTTLTWKQKNSDGSLHVVCQPPSSVQKFPVTLNVPAEQGFRSGTFCFDNFDLQPPSTTTTTTTATISFTSTTTTTTITTTTTSAVAALKVVSGGGWRITQSLKHALAGAVFVLALL